MIFFKRTSAVIDKTLEDLSRLSFYLAIVVQVIFLGLYGFKIYASRDKAIFLILYSVLAGLSLLSFVFYLWSHNEKNFAVVMARAIAPRSTIASNKPITARKMA